MTARIASRDKAFKRAMILSATAHVVLLLLIIVNPSLPKPDRKGMIHYITLNMPGSGGGGGGGSLTSAPKTELGSTEVKRDSLRDLTTLQKLQADEPSSQMRYPVEKPKKEPAKKTEKKATITKPDAKAAASAKESAPAAAPTGAAGGGSGLTIGLGGSGEGGGGGSGGGFPGDLGTSNFPYRYYLNDIQYKVQSNWFKSLVDPGVSGSFYVDVYFRIYRDGSISTVEIKASSSLKTLDQSAVRAVMQSAKFGPLPPGYEDEYLGIYLRFEHSK
jgi:outer membrane biosynthesis protein TonB